MGRDASDAAVRFTVEERPDVPVLGLLMGGSAMVPFPVLALVPWFGPAAWVPAALSWLVCWGAAILAFLAGVRRGLSFRTPGGERPAQIVTVLWLYLLAVGALLLPWMTGRLALLAAGYASLAVMDPAAARRREAPLFFARLRPVQMVVPLTALLAAAWFVWKPSV